MSHSLVFLGCSEPRGLTLGYTICKICRNKITLECMVCVFGRNLIQGWLFYSCPSSMRAEDSLRVGRGGVGMQGVKCCWHRYKSNFSLLHKFVIHYYMWPSSGQQSVLKSVLI